MRTVYTLRHAKSDWSDMSQNDHDRPLNTRGKKACVKMGGYFLAQDISPDLILCSTAVRARETLQRIMDTGVFNWRVHYSEELYLAPTHVMLNAVRSLPDTIKSVMLVGHNPGMHDFVLKVAKDGDSEHMQSLRTKYPTAGFAEISLNIDSLADLKIRSGRLRRFIVPKTLDVS